MTRRELLIGGATAFAAAGMPRFVAASDATGAAKSSETSAGAVGKATRGAISGVAAATVSTRDGVGVVCGSANPSKPPVWGGV